MAKNKGDLPELGIMNAFKDLVMELLEAIPNEGSENHARKLLNEMSAGIPIQAGNKIVRIPAKDDMSRLQNIMLKIEYGPEQ